MVQDDFLYKVSGVGGEVFEWSLDTGPLLRPASRYGGRAVTSVQEQNLEGVNIKGGEVVQDDFLYKVSAVGGEVIEWSLDMGPLLRPASRYSGRAVTSVQEQNLEGVNIRGGEVVQDDFLYKVSGVGGEVIEWSLDTGTLLCPASRYGGRALTCVQEQNLSLRGGEIRGGDGLEDDFLYKVSGVGGEVIEWSLDTGPLLRPAVGTVAGLSPVSKIKT